MTAKELKFTRFIRSKGMAFILAVLSVIMTREAAIIGNIEADDVNHGTIFPSPQLWFGENAGEVGMWLNIGLVLLTAMLMIYVNRRFNVLRTLSVYFGGLFLIMAAATPVVTVKFSGAVLLTIGILAAMSCMYRSFSRPYKTRLVLLAFLILGTGALTEYGFLFYVPVFLIGMLQMRIFNLRTVLAACLGLCAPLWIVWGAGMTPINPFSEIEITLPDIEDIRELPERLTYTSALAFTLLLGIILGLINFIKIYAYNARARAMNGLLSTVSIATGIFAVINYTNSQFYILMLDCCVAFQMGHFFRLYLHSRAYLLAIALMGIYGTLYFWAIMS